MARNADVKTRIGWRAGRLRKVDSVARQPAVTLVRWSIIEVDRSHRYLLGHCVENAEGRVSSPIVSIDVHNMHCVTTSGRIYILEGPSGFDTDANTLWEWLALRRGFKSWVAVTDRIVGLDDDSPLIA